MSRTRIAFWLLCALCWGSFLLGSVHPMQAQVQRVEALRDLSQISRSLPHNEINIPYLCARDYRYGWEERQELEKMALNLENDPDASQINAAIQCFLGKTKQAEAYFEKEQNGYSYIQKISILGESGNLDENQNLILDRGLSLQELVDVAEIIITNDWLENAAPLVEEIALRTGESAKLASMWLRIGDDLGKNNQWKDALAWYQKGLVIQTNWEDKGFRGSLNLRIGRIYQYFLDPQDPQSALVYYDRALLDVDRLSKWDQSNAYLFRGEVYRSLNQEFTTAQVLQELQKAININPDSYWAYMFNGHVIFYDMKDLDQAERNYQKAIVIDPNIEYAYYYLGEVYSAQGNVEKAIENYQFAINLNPTWQAPKDRLAALKENR